MKKATKQKKKDEPLRGGTNAGPSLDEWTEAARKVAEAQTADAKAAPPLDGDPKAAPAPADTKPADPPKPDHQVPPVGTNGQPVGDLAKPIETIIARATQSSGHVNDGDWRGQRKAELRDIAERRNEMVSTQNRLKGEYAAAKKSVEALDAELLAAVRDLDKMYPPKPQRLYPDPAPPAAKSKAKNAAPAQDGDQSWRTVPLASLNLPKGILEKLAKPKHKHRGAVPPIKTLGDLTEFLEPKNDWEPRLTDIEGLGKSAVDKITAATDQFWAERAKAK